MTHDDDAGRGSAQSSAGALLIVPVLAVALTLYYLVSTSDLTWEARSTGVIVGVVLLALCAAQFVVVMVRWWRGHWRGGFGELLAWSRHNRQRLGLLAILFAMVGLIPWIGTTLGVLLAMGGGMAAMGVRDLRALVVVAFATAGSVYLLFIVLLSSRLPRGVLENALSTLAGGGGG